MAPDVHEHDLLRKKPQKEQKQSGTVTNLSHWYRFRYFDDGKEEGQGWTETAQGQFRLQGCWLQSVQRKGKTCHIKFEKSEYLNWLFRLLFFNFPQIFRELWHSDWRGSCVFL